MGADCKSFCSEHSGNMVKIEHLQKEICDLKSALDVQKGYLEGRLNSTVADMKDLKLELTKKMDEGFKKLEEKMDEQSKEQNSKWINQDKNKSDKKWILIGSLGSPMLLIIFQQILEHFPK